MNPRLMCGAVLWGAMALTASPVFAQSGDLAARLMACRALGDVMARVACYDRLADGLRPTAPAPAATVPTRPAVTAPVAAPSAAAPPVVAAPAPAPAPASRFGAEDLPLQKRDPEAAKLPDQIIAKVVTVTANRQGLLTLTLDNGQTWRQTEGPEMRILPGAEIKIRSGLVGSYLLSLTSGNRSVRAKRVN